MKHFMKVSLMALVAMFVFNTTADAQLGGLLKKAKAAVSGNSSKNAYFEQQEKYEKLAKEQEAKNAAEAAAKAESLKMVEIKNWKTGQMEKVANPFKWHNEPIESYTQDKIYGWEKNFQDKAMNKKIIEMFIDKEKFDNRRRKADDMLKDRKVVEILFEKDSWKMYYDNLGDITSREQKISVVTELTGGYTVCEGYYVVQKYTGGGTYDETFSFNMIHTYSGGNPDGDWRFYVKDWEHKDNADPLAGL